jgi:DNA helicase-2/ATP-dependent DNA helicase PcrA
MPEYRVIGPPGCGKTTWLAKKIRKDVVTRGSESIVVASLTKTAAREVAGRDLPIDERQIGTLHSHAYHAIGTPKIADTATGLKEWNEYNRSHSAYQITTACDFDREADGGMGDGVQGEGNKVFGEIGKYRARRVPVEMWPLALQRFYRRWTEWKRDNEYLDFTDLIEVALRDVNRHPLDPEVFLIDEAQDMDALEFALARKWGEHCDQFVVVGDADQCLYEWRGSDSRVMMNPELPTDRVHVLKQSWRVPRAVHAKAVNWINKATDRKNVEYLPREEPGFTYSLGDGNYQYPKPILDDAERHLADGKSVMFLTACGYMLNEIIVELRRRGLPFHNPYRRKRGDWNPMVIGRKRMTVVNRILAFLRPDVATWGEDARMWNKYDAQLWMSILKSKGNLKRGVKTNLDEVLPGLGDEWEEPLPLTALMEVMEMEAFERAMELDLDWLRLNSDKKLDFICDVAKKHGGKALSAEPKIIVGTIHSVKGGEADVVYVFPDLSRNGIICHEENSNPTIRQFYVAFTRAREGLILCPAASSSAVVF